MSTAHEYRVMKWVGHLALNDHVFVRVFLDDEPRGSMYIPQVWWDRVVGMLEKYLIAQFEATMIDEKCSRCTFPEEDARVTCQICDEPFCENCWGDHPHAHGVHIAGSTK